MEYATLPFRRYLDFSGRSRRREYWTYVLVLLIVSAIAALLDRALGLGGTFSRSYVSETGGQFDFHAQGGLLSGLWGIFNFIPGLAVSVRRLHDTNRSAWWLLVLFVPLAGFIIWLVFMCRGGTPGPNRFGQDPKAGSTV